MNTFDIAQFPIVQHLNPTASFQVNNSTNPERPFWQWLTDIELDCDWSTADDYDCPGDCVATLHLAAPEDGDATVWHLSAADAISVQFRKISQ